MYDAFPFPFPVDQPRFKTVKVANSQAEEFLKRMCLYLSKGGLKEARINSEGKVIHKRKYAFSWGAFGLTFVGVLILLAFLMYTSTHFLTISLQSPPKSVDIHLSFFCSNRRVGLGADVVGMGRSQN